MQTNKGKRRLPRFAREFAVLSAALAVAAAGSASAAPTETVLHSFAGGSSDGAFPVPSLIADSKGNFYGTTRDGGNTGCGGFGGFGCGVVFKLSPGGTETVLYSFCSKPGCSDGANPEAGLIADRHGNLYGTTNGGGATGCSGTGCGVVFKLSPAGTERVLYSFCSLPGCSDGANPIAGLIADSHGTLYGTTATGGTGCGGPGCGVVFKLSPRRTETVLHSFTGSDGAAPAAGLIADSAGNLYGTTQFAGPSDSGSVFKLSPGGTETVLYTFCSLTNCRDGASPVAGLIIDGNGNLYGTTNSGGATRCFVNGCGVVFKVSPGGTETVLYSFKGPVGDGAFPIAGLIADSSGNLYGTTTQGGASGTRCDEVLTMFGCGTVFKLAGTGFVAAKP